MKRMLDNLEAFTKQLVDFIANNTEQGHQNLLDVFAKASEEYDKPKKSYLWSWIYSYSRMRSEAFTHTMQKLNAFPDPITRLKAFKEFISTGGWTSTSANMDLFKALIEAIPGYEKEEDALLTGAIIPRLNQLLIGVIDPLITQFERAREERETREKELTEMRREKTSAMEHLALFVDESLAIEFAKENPSKAVFHLGHNGSHWQLSWLDSKFKSIPLDICLELGNFLNSIKEPSILDAHPDKLIKIKEHCLQALNRLLNKVKFVISPSGYLQPDLVSTFTVVGHSGDYSLDWYDSLGKRKPIDLRKYPSFDNWLKELSCIEPQHFRQLKTFLHAIDVSYEVQLEQQLSQFLKTKYGVALIAATDINAIPRYKLITGTFLLTKEMSDAGNPQWVLYQRQKGGINQLINTQDWAAFHALMARCDNLSPEQLSAKTQAQIRQFISNPSLARHANKVRCYAVNSFSQEELINCEPDSFLVSFAGDWKLIYLKLTGEPRAVLASECPGVERLFRKWNDRSTLQAEDLTELSIALVDFKPLGHINLADFRQLEACLNRRPAELPPKIESKAAPKNQEAKLKLSDYAAITRLFGHKPVATPPHLEADLRIEVGCAKIQ